MLFIIITFDLVTCSSVANLGNAEKNKRKITSIATKPILYRSCYIPVLYVSIDFEQVSFVHADCFL